MPPLLSLPDTENGVCCFYSSQPNQHHFATSSTFPSQGFAAAKTPCAKRRPAIVLSNFQIPRSNRGNHTTLHPHPSRSLGALLPCLPLIVPFPVALPRGTRERSPKNADSPARALYAAELRPLAARPDATTCPRSLALGFEFTCKVPRRIFTRRLSIP